MAETIARSAARLRWRVRLSTLFARLLVAMFVLLIGAQLVFFAAHAAHLLAYPYPLDYGEGPLLAQVDALRHGVSVARLYGDPAAPPYQVVNYPPLYHVATLLVVPLAGSTLLAGRLVSLFAAFGVLLALCLLVQSPDSTRPRDRETGSASFLVSVPPYLLVCLSLLIFLALPLVREWAVVMRVDMLGVCLGLWGLVVVQRYVGRRAVLWAAPLLIASLFVKPSLIAAPISAVTWLLVRDWRRGVWLALAIAGGGGILAALLQTASSGWFLLHVIEANSNAWQFALAFQFWRDQMLLHSPLVLAALLAVLWRPRNAGGFQSAGRDLLLPAIYMLCGVVTAIGVGKVGAYANYFLEMYAGIVWLVAAHMQRVVRFPLPASRVASSCHESSLPASRFPLPASRMTIIMLGLLIGGTSRYYPMWSEHYLKLAGILEPNPARLVVGGYGVWSALQREREILQTLGGVNAALNAEVRAAHAPIFTDVPGVAAQAGTLSRLQAFEHRQLVDSGLWNQRPLLRDLANGRVPLLVLDYLGNWLTPEMIALIQHRYAQDGSRGTYDLYRPVEAGPRLSADLALPGGLRVSGYHLAPSFGAATYHPGEPVVLTLELTTDDRRPTTDDRHYDVVVRLQDRSAQTLAESIQPLLYGALSPKDWVAEPMEHMQIVRVPETLPPGQYTLAVGLREAARELAPPRPIAQLDLAAGGRVLVNRSAATPRAFFVPAPLLDAWQRAGGAALLGEPLTPAVPFAAYVEQCFARGCVRQHGAVVERVPLGEIVRLSETAAGAHIFGELRGAFRDFWQINGGAALLGEPISAEFVRGDSIVQYTRYARLERPIAGGTVRLARLGDEFIRLPPWEPYRWP